MRNGCSMIELVMLARRPMAARCCDFRAWSAWLAILPLLAGCASEPPETVVPPADAVATWSGGFLSLPEVESAFAEARSRACSRARRGGGLEELVPCYRELAEEQVLERLVLSEVEDVDAAIADLENYKQLRRQAFLEAFTLRLSDQVEIDDGEIEAHFEAHREDYRRPGTVNLANIFRRHDDPARPEDTLKFLRALKERFEAGETFDALAREASHSETRLRGGEVGQVREGELPARLEKIAFGLGDGEVSDPIRVRDGAVLLHVRGVVEGVEPSLAGAQERIRRELAAKRVENMVSERAAVQEPPPDALVLELEELIEALDRGDPEGVVLEIDGDRLQAGDFRRLARLGARQAGELAEAARDRLAELYLDQKEQRLLALGLVESADSELADAAKERLRRVAISQLVDERLQGDMEQQIEEETLRGYFEDNRHHYQSPLRFNLRVWNVPFGDDPPAQQRRMEALRERLVAGELDLTAATAELAGGIDDLGWREFDSLTEDIPGKARTYLMEVEVGGFSAPYQQDDALHLIQLVEREEPRPLAYEEAAARVRTDYLVRFGQELYRRVAEERLDAVEFAFAEEVVRRLLTGPGEETLLPEPDERPAAPKTAL